MPGMWAVIAAGCSCHHGVQHTIAHSVVWGGGVALAATTFATGLRKRRDSRREDQGTGMPARSNSSNDAAGNGRE